MIKKNKYIILIFLLVVLFRLFFVFQVDGFNGDSSYANLRQVGHISENFTIMSYDELSFSGRDLFVAPLFYYFMAFLDFFLPAVFVFKVVPSLLIGGLVVLIYLIVREISGNEIAAFLSALSAGFFPIFIENTLNNVSVYSLFLIILFYLFYLFIKIYKDKGVVDEFVFFLFLLPLIHPSAIVFVITLIFYSILLFTEGVEFKKIEREVVMFSVFFIFLVSFILYKEAFLEYGVGLIRGIMLHVGGMDLVSLFVNIGVLPIFLGAFGIYYGLFKTKRKGVFLFSSFGLGVLTLLLFELIDLYVGMMFLGLSFIVLMGFALGRFFGYLKVTKLSKYRNAFVFLFLGLIVVLNIVPSYYSAVGVVENSFSLEEIEGVNLIDGVVMADVSEGNFLNYYGGGSVFDTNSLLIEDYEERASDVSSAFMTISKSVAEGVFEKYDVGYIYFSFRAKESYGVSELGYLDECFERISRGEDFELYEVKC